MDEFAIINNIFKSLSNGDENSLGLLDDVAIIPNTNNKMIFTTDTIIEGTHFLRQNSMFDIGYKLVMVNVSDIIAKGAKPIASFLNFCAPKGIIAADIANFTNGMNEAREDYGNFPILGGDTTTTQGNLTLSLSLIGQCIGNAPILRKGCMVGDDIYVTGTIGDAFIGLKGMMAVDGFMGYKNAIEHYNRPKVPNIKIADLVSLFANCSMDVSDGLLGDLSKILELNNNGATINLDKVPLSNDALNYVNQGNNIDGIMELLTFGDDYQTLFTANPDKFNEINEFASANDLMLSKIGMINGENTLKLNFLGTEIRLAEKLSYAHEIS